MDSEFRDPHISVVDANPSSAALIHGRETSRGARQSINDE